MRNLIFTLGIIGSFALPGAADAATLVVLPENPIQGDPIMISVEGATATNMSFGDKSLRVFMYKGRPTALYGFDINKKAGVYKVSATLSDGTMLQRQLLVDERMKPTLSFTIPAKLGGTTTASQKVLVSTLASENATLIGLKTGDKAFWSEPFSYPLPDPIVTDAYGYDRDTGAATVTHKGADFRAKEGTPVESINRGVVRRIQNTRDYGKTVIVDHGLGLMSMYMHLSSIWVNEGELVKRGQYVGLSGQTGYALAPHLHLTIRQDDVSIDPETFLKLFK